MKSPVKWVGLAAGITAILAASLLLMGNLQSAARSAQETELLKVESLARIWESQLEVTRAVFHDQIYRQEWIPILEHLDEWTTWRTEPKLASFVQTWPKDAGTVRSVLLLDGDDATAASYGDTSGAAFFAKWFKQSATSDIAFSPSTGDGTGLLAYCYVAMQTDENEPAGSLIAILNASSICSLAPQPTNWALLADPQHAVVSSHWSLTESLVNKATWPLLMQRSEGTLKYKSNGVLAFSRISVPGLPPLLLMSVLSTGTAGDAWICFLGILSGVFLAIYCLWPRSPKARIETTADKVENPGSIEVSARANAETFPDGLNPFPVLNVTPEGLIRYYNEAALRACPRIKDSPLLADILPSVEPRSLPVMLQASSNGFESLLGSVPYHFAVVVAEDGIILYAHPLSSSQSLQVALQQSQENFNALCAVSPYPILLVDPRNHMIMEANPAAAAFFDCDATTLRGRILDSLATAPIDLTASHSTFETETADGHSTCDVQCAMMKIEGIPTVLVSLHSLCEYSNLLQAESEAAEATSPVEETNLLPTGPALLISYSPVVREVARRLLEKSGHEPMVFSQLDDATVWLITAGCCPEFVTIDISEFTDAPDWLAEVRERCGNVPCIAITDGVTNGLTSGPNAFLVKPFDLDSLSSALNELNISAEFEVTL